MKRVLTIAANLFRRLMRSGTVLGLIIMTSVVAAFIFWFARSDGVLANELQIRLRYSFYFCVALMNLGLLFIACTTLRRDIERRHFHMVSSAPLHRAQIWLGNYLGILCLGILTFLSCSATIGTCTYIYITGWDKPDEVKQLQAHLSRAHYVCNPERPKLDDQVEMEFKRLQLSGVKFDKSDRQVRMDIFQEIRKKEQMLPPNGSKSWTFRLDPQSAQGNNIILKTKFFSEKKRVKVNGIWTLKGKDSPEIWATEFSGYPYLFHELEIPLDQVPATGDLIVEFKGTGSPYLIFPRTQGVILMYDNGSIAGNYLRLLLFSVLNMATLSALALAFASMFTYSVAIFATVVFYVVGLSTDFFSAIAKELAYNQFSPSESSLVVLVSRWFIQLGVWLTRGIKPLPVIDQFSDGISIPLASLYTSWGWSFVTYTVLLIVVGCVILTKKEIDKIIYG